MNRLLILILVSALLLSGCVEKTVKKGDNISVDYVGSFEDGKVFDTSIKSVAEANNLSTPGATYEPLKFTVGATPRAVIEGFDEGVIGMKVGETKQLNIPPEKAYPINPDMIQVIPIVENIPAITIIPKERKVPVAQFEQVFGQNHSVGDTVQFPDSNINIIITNINRTNISSGITFKYNVSEGFKIWNANAPWNQTVIKIDDKNISMKPDVKINDTIQLQNLPFNTTVMGLNNTHITLKHNSIPDKTVDLPGMFGQMVSTKISFNETSVIMDQNFEVAGKPLIFNVTLRSIDK